MAFLISTIMGERLWDFFVDTMITLFMPLVCSYFTLSADLYFNVAARDATGCEWVGNTLLSPLQYILVGQEAVPQADGTWKFVRRFDYKQAFWFKTAASIAALPPSLILGTAVKGVSLLSQSGRERLKALQAAKRSIKTQSHQAMYRSMGLALGEIAEWQEPMGFTRRPGDEKTLAVEKKALAEITLLFNEAGIPWWVDCGTCLGAYRYGGVIPWDGDIDIAVLQNDFENIVHILNKLDPNKYHTQDWSTRDHPDSFLKVYIRESGTMIDIYHFDIFPEKRELHYIFSVETNMFFPEWFKIRERRFKAPVAFETVFPLKKMLFDGVEVFVPRDMKTYLQRCYGENLDPVKIYNPETGRYERDLRHPYWLRAYVH